MFGLTIMDYVVLSFFCAAWLGYNLAVERFSIAASSLNKTMDKYRSEWMRQLTVRDNRIVDTTIMGSLQNGAAFFASTSLLALGGALSLFRSPDEVLVIMAAFPLGDSVSRMAWETKTLGLTFIFIYAFFKFGWAYRIFNYAAILVGAVPVIKMSEVTDEELQEAYEAADRAARMNTVAGRHFNRGQRAFFFALAYLSWFISAYALLLATAAVLFVMWRRQFASKAKAVFRPKK